MLRFSDKSSTIQAKCRPALTALQSLTKAHVSLSSSKRHGICKIFQVDFNASSRWQDVCQIYFYQQRFYIRHKVLSLRLSGISLRTNLPLKLLSQDFPRFTEHVGNPAKDLPDNDHHINPKVFI